LRLLRRGLVLGIIAALALAVFKPDFSTSSAIGRFLQRIEENPWPAVGIGVLAVLLVSSFIRRVETG
jgi:hypothetical protein